MFSEKVAYKMAYHKIKSMCMEKNEKQLFTEVLTMIISDCIDH